MIVGLCGYAGTRVFQEGQKEKRLPHTFIQFQEEIKMSIGGRMIS